MRGPDPPSGHKSPADSPRRDTTDFFGLPRARIEGRGRRSSLRSWSDLDHDLDRFAVVHRPVAVGHPLEAHHAVEDVAGFDPAFEDVRQELLDVGTDGRWPA